MHSLFRNGRLFTSLLSAALVLSACAPAAPAATETDPLAIAAVPQTYVTEPAPVFLDPAGSVTELASAVYPSIPPYPEAVPGKDFDQSQWNKDYDRWAAAIAAQKRDPAYKAGLEGFWNVVIQTWLTASPGENKVISPVNIYLSLGILGQITGGTTQAQILSRLGEDMPEHLRFRMHDLCSAQYLGEGPATQILANSLWLNESLPYRQELLEDLAYCAMTSSFLGTPGSVQMDEAFQDWINTQTGGLLADSVKDLHLSPNLAVALASTVRYQAKWSDAFDPARTGVQTFYGETETQVSFLHGDLIQPIYQSPVFTALSLGMKSGGGSLLLFLPGPGMTPEQLAVHPELAIFLQNPAPFASVPPQIIHFAMPKFEITSDTDLSEGLQKMGITEVFSTAADFTPLIANHVPAALTEAKHAVRFAADEEGVTAASYVEMQMAGAGRPPEQEVDFVLDRPFLFVLKSNDGLPLFAGIVNNP